MSTTETTWVPPSVLERMSEELETLSADPSPSPTVEERIRALRDAIRSAETSEKPDDGLVEAGMLVTALFAGDGHPTSFLVGPRSLVEADPSIAVDVYSPTSPLGRAIDGAHVGDTVQYASPSGRSITLRILAAEPFRG
ncbi:transcription elongation factor GreA [Curtobacterium pusillum]|uniref:Transcription elongation factor GreA n=1 Tax=Curtobacterium pusillum TaxID=69373 RepID=A0AAW3T9E9_9MICO|nr:GreA/GreB family elongation factor [Curtobacterium pusillum]MBA8990843.1 transcription elongation factor GreA [Curtobacterium pusillum]